MPNQTVRAARISCPFCGYASEDRGDFIQRNVEGVELNICPSCFQENFISCADCGCVVTRTTSRRVHALGNRVCLNCYTRYQRCATCGELTNDTNGEGDCSHCQDRYVHCVSCDERVRDGERYIGSDGSIYCEDCFNENFICCDNCSHPIGRDSDDRFETEEGETLCRRCYDARNSRDRNRQVNPSLFFDKTYGIRRAFGIELECVCNEDYGVSSDLWDIGSDGSICPANNQRGEEHRSLILQGDSGLDCIKDHVHKLNDSDYGVNTSCGFHVHIDARDLKKADVLNIVSFLKVFEPLIYGLVPPSRVSGSYAKPMTISASDIRQLRTSRKTLKFFAGMERYRGFNLQAFFEHGSLEFRYHSGTLSYKKIEAWILLCLLIVEKGRLHNWKLMRPLRRRNLRNLARFFKLLGLDVLNDPLCQFLMIRFNKFNPNLTNPFVPILPPRQRGN